METIIIVRFIILETMHPVFQHPIPPDGRQHDLKSTVRRDNLFKAGLFD
ncbi:hypothetical protein [Mucilaginibacter phyllosphaerae]|uniref:Uncharacterized protein n=1 Tax=Mucilaginibacter phyllosphaerae TaxID=1812349 RepID=A0ABR6I8Z4_9SPHI|nr:hypothetical protein [Mucilaginibacter phyllosphaerae]MBB3969518.1 hypothetical protein [Mucilaginibacter phyllosphaerae]